MKKKSTYIKYGNEGDEKKTYQEKCLFFLSPEKNLFL